MTAAPAPASAHTNRWKVISSFQKEILREKWALDCFSLWKWFIQLFENTGFLWVYTSYRCLLTSFDPHILLNLSDPEHTVFSSPMGTTPKIYSFCHSSRAICVLGYRNGYFTLLFGYLDNQPIRKNKITATKEIITETTS